MAWYGHRHITKYDGSTQDSWGTFFCGHCDTQVTGPAVASHQGDHGGVVWLLCTNCDRGLVSNDGVLTPGRATGPTIAGLPPAVAAAYHQARRSMSVNAFTGVELICRKILMHVAVEKGAEEGDTFASYITYLANQGYVTPPMNRWVNVIREHGNRATHELDEPDETRAESTLFFTAELLRLIYEMEQFADRYAPQA